MKKTADVAIAGKLKASDWWRLRDSLVPGEQGGWSEAVESYFMQRISLRYLRPIRTLQTRLRGEGEGFSMVALQCTLIEFLAAVRVGKTYKYADTGGLGDHEYNDSQDLFVRFLRGHPPFADCLTTRREANSFYVSIRCGLLHEASTKNGWLISLSGEPGIDPKAYVVYRNTLQDMLEDYISDYAQAVLVDKQLQSALKRKFDALSGWRAP